MSLLPWLKKLDNPPPSVEDASIDREEPEAAVQDIQATEASTSSLVEDTTSLIPDSPNQPELSFPQRIFGTQKRSFCSSWYGKYKWLHYLEGTDRVFAIIVYLLTNVLKHVKMKLSVKLGFAIGRKHSVNLINMSRQCHTEKLLM